jgi:hypothetical protein
MSSDNDELDITSEEAKAILLETVGKIPEQVRIGYTDYKIVKTSDPASFVNKSGLLGFVEYKTATIYIADDLPKQVEASTLLHEIIHGINFHFGQGQNGREWEEEDYVGATTNGICQLFQQNTHFLLYLLANLGIDGFSVRESSEEAESEAIN